MVAADGAEGKAALGRKRLTYPVTGLCLLSASSLYMAGSLGLGARIPAEGSHSWSGARHGVMPACGVVQSWSWLTSHSSGSWAQTNSSWIPLNTWAVFNIFGHVKVMLQRLYTSTPQNSLTWYPAITRPSRRCTCCLLLAITREGRASTMLKLLGYHPLNFKVHS